MYYGPAIVDRTNYFDGLAMAPWLPNRYDYHQHQINLTQAIFAFDTFPSFLNLQNPH